MKKIIIIAALLLLLVSCGATKKTMQTNEMHIDSLAASKSMSEQVEKIVDTTRTEHGKITITEIDFFQSPIIEPNARADLTNFGNVQGVVKSIRQTVIESNVEEKGESNESRESNESDNVATVTKIMECTDKQQEPAKDPYRWRYIFFISLFAGGVLLYLKRMPVCNWIKKILQGFLKIL